MYTMVVEGTINIAIKEKQKLFMHYRILLIFIEEEALLQSLLLPEIVIGMKCPNLNFND